MTRIFAQLSAGQPGMPGLAPSEKPPGQDDAHLVDVPVLDSPDAAGNVPACRLRAACGRLLTGSREVMRARARVLQLLLTVGALAFVRPWYMQPVQLAAILVLAHSFVISFVLLWDKRCCGTIVRRLLPHLDWPSLELRYTSTVALLLYILFFGQIFFSHMGYGLSVASNWVSVVCCLLTALAYGLETWLLLRTKYDGRPSTNNQ